MKAVKITLAGQDYYLTFNGAAMFAFEDAFDGGNGYFEKSSGAGREAFDATCKAVSILAEQGELARRALGYDKGPLLTEERALALATPLDAVMLRRAALEAILAGYGREVESGEDVDVGLMELEQKKQKADPRALSAHGVGSGVRRPGDHADGTGAGV